MKYLLFALIYLSSSAAVADDTKLKSDAPDDAGYIYFCENPDTKDQVFIEPLSGKNCPEGYERYTDITALTESVEGVGRQDQQPTKSEPDEE